jgi:hypothetical protein
MKSKKLPLLCKSKYFMEQKHLEQLEALKDIRQMMDKSSRFLSLSGLAGIWTGVCALAGVSVMYLWLRRPWVIFRAEDYMDEALGNHNWGLSYQGAFLLIGVATLIAALLGVLFFNARRAKKQGYQLWDTSARRVVVGLLIPMTIGAVFCMALAQHQLVGLIAPATLVFYGLALVHIDKLTIGNMRQLGMAQAALGLMGMFAPGYGLQLWGLGFGVLHILYGAWIYRITNY